MKVLLCFDCDGTLFGKQNPGPLSKSSKGLVFPERLTALADAGAQVVIVSPSDACDELPYPRLIHPIRAEALREAARRYPADLRLYVSDNPGDERVAEKAGFCYIHPSHFV